MLDPLPSPAIFAHRGASAYAPENTMAAFAAAVQQGADAIELDVKLSADGCVVVIHDSHVDRTTDGKGRVRDLSLSELRLLDAGTHFDREFQGERIPTLEQVLARFGKRIWINIELTNLTTPADQLPLKAGSLVLKLDLSEWILFSSFNPLALLRVRRVCPRSPIALLALPGAPGGWARSRWIQALLSPQALHPHHSDVDSSFLRRSHHRGRRVHAYTVNQEDHMRRLFHLGVDGVFTDDPPLAHQALKRSDGSAAPPQNEHS